MKKTIVITGATSGIGELLARALAVPGNTLIITGRNSDKLWRLKKELSEFCDKVIVRPAHLEHELSVKSFSKKEIGSFAKKNTNTAFVLINSAADFGPTKNLLEISSQEMQTSFNVNTLAPMILVQRMLPYMIERKFGRIINIGSSAALTGYSLRMPYCVTKSALVGFTKTLNSEVISGEYGRGLDIKAFCVCPGPVAGERLEKQIRDRAITKGTTVAQIRPKFEKINGGILDPQEVVNQVVALLDEGDAYAGQEMITFKRQQA